MVESTYSSIPSEQYRANLAAIKIPEPEEFRTFREDYEIGGAEEGEVEVTYSGSCTVCRLALQFSHAEALPL
jgi:hypothetical protein